MGIIKTKTLVAIMGDPLELIVLLLIATCLGLVIAFTYKKTHRGFSYSQSFSITTVLITVITALIIILIEDNIARAIGIFGAFSIIRFRTAVKDVRDIAFIFFSLAIGLAIGTGAIGVGAVGVLFICALIFALHKSNFGGLRKYEYVLNFKMEAKDHSNDVFKKVMVNHLKKQTLLNVEAKDRGQLLAFTFNISLRDGEALGLFIADMNKLEGLSDVNVISSKNDLDF